MGSGRKQRLPQLLIAMKTSESQQQTSKVTGIPGAIVCSPSSPASHAKP